MRLKEYEVIPYKTDVLIRVVDNGETGEIWLGAALNDHADWAEKFMCEANAKEVYQVATVLELCASDLRNRFEKWKREGFQK